MPDLRKKDFDLSIENLKTFEDFKDAVKSIVGTTDISKEWLIGGIGGGSCWDDGSSNPHYARQADEEPEDESLDLILEVLCPKISFLQYKKLTKENLFIETEKYYNEYYGNHSEYRIKTLNLEVLFNTLKEIYE